METKPAIYTTEFWLTIIAQVIFLLNTVQVWTYMSQRWSGLIQAIILAAYTLSRGWAKSGVGPNPDVPANAMLFPSRRDMHARVR